MIWCKYFILDKNCIPNLKKIFSDFLFKASSIMYIIILFLKLSNNGM